MNALLAPYRLVNRVRRWLYRRGVLKAKRLPKRVISIGALSAGGAGKTPATIAVARFLISRGLTVAVLTRGYRRRGAGGEVTELDPDRFGDEPVLIKKNVPNAHVIVGPNRYENGLQVSCDVYLLDDGFQHLRLHRDVDLVIDDPQARFFREGRSALRDADVVIPRRVRSNPPAERLFAFAGLADNEQFFRSLPNVAGTMSFPDHHRYTPDDLARIRKAAGGLPIVTTEKDAVKLAGERDIIAVPLEFLIDPDVLERLLR